MKIIHNIWDFTASKGSVVTIGTFDGVHLGHKEIITKVVQSGKERGLIPTVFTFFPHPRMVLQPEVIIKQIQTLDEKSESLRKLGIELLIIQPFDQDFANLSAEDFVEKILVKHLNAKKIIIGYDHRFGKNRIANITDLKRFGEKYNFEVEEISAQEINEVTISSTKIRKALEEGNIVRANSFLGYPFLLSGKVIHGLKLGRTLSYPTANISIDEEYKFIPKPGVYVVSSNIDETRYFGMMSIGNNPTIENKGKTIEVYFFDFEGDLYDRFLTIQLLDYIRDEQKFSSINELKQQLQKDEIVARNICKKIS